MPVTEETIGGGALQSDIKSGRNDRRYQKRVVGIFWKEKRWICGVSWWDMLCGLGWGGGMGERYRRIEGREDDHPEVDESRAFGLVW
jgi:hypothetical protein